MSLIEKIALKPCPFCGGEAHMRGCLLDERFGYAGVQQCDREAAAAYYEARYPSDQTMPWAIREGQADSALVVQAFARHRSTAAAAERARIVAWLRRASDGYDNPSLLAIADAIERGEV